MRILEKFQFYIEGSLYSKYVPINFNASCIPRYNRLIFNSVSLSSLDEVRQHVIKKFKEEINVIKDVEKQKQHNLQQPKKMKRAEQRIL